ncbi:MAG: cyclic nucleotide-binding domain-containing protein [Proteobacteria bacterium]|nr:cyclic nucleotide-binding domain-containing protein [Pseudomonadota bacterium]MDA1024311.1 cyclic nucleotide-binding domain-containing protein [Pseudomonadota bacterium]
MTHINTLKNSELFQDISDPSLEAISALINTVNVEEGDSVYQLGDDASDLYLLIAGRIRFSLGEGSGSVILPGNVFGWAALLGDQPRRVATASCLEDSTLGVISGQALLDHFEADKTMGYFVMRRLATMIASDFMSVLSV